MENVFEWVTTYGYIAIFLSMVLGIVGLPIPDETIMVFSGYLISTGRLHPVGAFLAALAGSWSGITVSYWIGRTFGVGAINRFGKYFHLTPNRLETVHQWFHRAGHWALFIGYYIAGVRHFTAIVAGTSKLEFRTFAAYAWTGGAVWVATFLTLGYYLGENWREISEVVHRDGLYLSIAIIALLGVYWLWRKRTPR